LGVDSVSPVNPIPADPIAYPVRASHERLAEAVREGRTEEPHHECEARQCRVVLAAHRREIDRLRRALVQAPRADVELPAPDPMASPPTERMTYAPDPIGKPPVLRESLPPDAPPPVSVLLHEHFTLIGSLLDVVG
jgi:hypothetical protein